MRIEQLQYVAAVNELGGLRRASAQLHVSQPALSEAVSKLERELGVTLLDRRRAGARISRQGRELLPYLVEVLAAVDRLRSAAGDQQAADRPVRIGTVTTATTQVLLPSVRRLHDSRDHAAVEVRDMIQSDIQVGLEEGTLDLGLVNLLEGDDTTGRVSRRRLLAGRAVVVLPAWHRLADASEVDVEQLRAETFIWMRSGYVMHRLATRIFGDRLPAHARTTEGAEMGKIMVAEGLGVTLLPDFSVIGDPLVRAGAITPVPVASETPPIELTLLGTRDPHIPDQVLALAQALTERAHEWRRRNPVTGPLSTPA